jgi:tetratricopeptide (TPR) repeat protein
LIAKSLKPSALIALLVVSALILVVGLIWFTCSRNAESEFYYNRALHLAAGADYDEAISDYTEAIRLYPGPKASAFWHRGEANTYYRRGNAYFDKKDYAKAISDYTEVIRLNPNSALAYNSRARAFEAQGKHVEAQADFDKAKELGYTGPQ